MHREARKRVPATFYVVVCNNDVDQSLFGGLPAARLERSLRSAKATRKLENERCCDGGHRIVGLSTWELKP